VRVLSLSAVPLNRPGQRIGWEVDERILGAWLPQFSAQKLVTEGLTCLL